MNKTSIEWTDFTWNPVTGCHKISPGCKNCYAETLTNRFAKPWGVKSFRDVVLHEDRLNEPLKNQKKWAGKKVFVCSMSDLFQEDVPFDFISKVILKIAELPDTIFQVLTKRPERALEWFEKYRQTILKYVPDYPVSLPRNLWIGTSVENQQTANERIPFLIRIPVAVRFLSCEPLLGPIDLTRIDPFIVGAINSLRSHPCSSPHKPFIDWVIAGGESGHGARPMHPDWVRSLRDVCAFSGVPFFFKQWGEWAPDSHVSENHPFLIRSSKHYLVNIDGEAYPYGDQMLWPGERSRYTAKENERANECVLTKEDNAYFMANLGKSKSGNTLDGKQHLNFPVG